MVRPQDQKEEVTGHHRSLKGGAAVAPPGTMGTGPVSRVQCNRYGEGDTMASIRTIEAAPSPTRYARGWHSLGLAADYRDGKPHPVSAFGTRLVVFMGEDGKLCILNAYCPHMGADLNLG